MNAISLLTQDHRNVEALFKRFEATDDPKEKRSITDKVIEQLSVHAELEEQFFYPAVMAKVDGSGKDDVLEGIEEHHLAKVALWELERLPATAPNFDAKFKVLSENILHHVEEEEADGGIFADARKALKANELEELGDRMQAARTTVPSRPHPLAPPTPPINRLLGLPVAVLDRAVNTGKGLLRAVLPGAR
ncbi:MAG: hemerythrin domain-containing protein [Acidimicrobiia bacterium]|nr:hemerythrin domain-containing protein [Acidimicrobiia bacterium]